jgi:two-component system osmolarity sensor histidine kinase EnvZ
MFSWIKQYMPKRLYWRAALILILPVVLIQLLVSFVFIQRHFEGVTEQLTRGLTQELAYFDTLIRSGDIDGAQAFADALDISLSVNPEGAFQPTRRFYDLTGIVVIRELSRIASLRGVDLPDDRIVILRMAISGYEELELTFARRRVSASNPHQLIVNMVFLGAFSQSSRSFICAISCAPSHVWQPRPRPLAVDKTWPIRPAARLRCAQRGMHF